VKHSGQIVLGNALATFSSSSSSSPSPSPSAAPSASPKLKSSPVFEVMDKTVKGNPALLKKVGAVYQFNLKHAGGVATFTVDVKNQATVGVHQGKLQGVKPDCTITMTDEDYLSMSTGALNPMSAFSSGKLQMEGNVMLAQKLSALTDQAKL
jgi:3-hydroxyacyl-CoA dehydrogenase/3a,7a,12a-trihydroxy-5b-cholest-24-enoyl-CoA hydratase